MLHIPTLMMALLLGFLLLILNVHRTNCIHQMLLIFHTEYIST